MLRSISLAGAMLWAAAAAFAQDAKPTDTVKADTVKVQQLQEISVKSQRNAIEKSPGKTILNVQSLSGAAGKNVLELLRRTPGVTVDGQGNIAITGKQGVRVMINGRPTYLSGDDLRDYLESINADEVAQVEVMTQPSAQYDAEGNAGIINLKMRKNRRKGFNGNANMAWTKSQYESTHNSTLINYNTGKNNWYSNGGYVNGRNGVDWKQDMVFKDAAGNAMAYTTMTSRPREMFEKSRILAGVDRNCNEHTSMGINASMAYNTNQMNTPITTETAFASGGTESSARHTNENSIRKNYTANAYMHHSFSKQSDLSVNVDYLLYTKSLYQYLSTEAWRNGMLLPDQLTLKSHIPTSNALHSIKADHSYTTGDGLKIESGCKYVYANIDNAANFMKLAQNNWLDDNSRTNHFLYSEHISAVYINGIKKIDEHWDVQAGLRGEYAYLEGLQQATGQSFTRKLPAMFPTAYVSYKPDSANALELNYGRRVQRPHYSMLNPFNYYTFYNAYQRGNPNLLPQYAHNMELRHSYKNRITSELSVNHITDEMSYVNMPDSGQTTYGIPINAATTTTCNLGITYNGKPANWCELTVHGSAVYALYKSIVNNVPLQRAKVGYTAWLNSRLVLGKGWDADCYVNYQSALAASAMSISKPTLYSNFGVSKKLFHDTTTLRLSVDDPFYVNRNGYDDELPTLSNKTLLIPNSRYATFAATYNFGQNNRARRQQSELEEARRM